MIPKNKKGMNQVEYISAMLIFLFGVIVIMYFALTFNLIQHKDYLTAVENNLKKEIEIEYSKYYIGNTAPGNCFNISQEDIPRKIIDNRDKLTILNSDGEGMRFKWYGNNLVVDGNSDQYTFIISPNSSVLSEDICTGQSSNPNFSFEEKFNAISLDKLDEFKYKYDGDYENISEIIAENKNFNIDVSACPPNFIGKTISRWIPRNVEVTAGEFPAKLFITPEIICDVKITIKLWD